MATRTRYLIRSTGVPTIAVLADGPATALQAAVRHLEQYRPLHRGVTPVKNFNPATSTYAITQPRLPRPVYVTVTPVTAEESNR